MAQTPQRPFVPQRTPSAAHERANPAEFRLARPFVHGAPLEPNPTPQRPQGQTAPSSPAVRSAPPPLPLVYNPPPPATASSVGPAVHGSEPLGSIAEYLHAGSRVEPARSNIDADSYEPPPVEHFMDTPPEQAAFSSTGTDDAARETSAGGGTDEGLSTAEWGDVDWQQFDWRSAAALGDPADSAATSAWSETNWENAPPPAREIRDAAAKAIADALDGIARRIREGELAVPGQPGSSPPSPKDIAATLAALLGVRR